MRTRLVLESLDARIVPTFYGNQLFPLDNPWNQDVSAALPAGNSDAIINAIVNRHTSAPRLHADFGNPVTDGELWGIPINVADSATPKYTVVVPNFGYPDESDSVQVPIPANAVLEGDNWNGPGPASQRGDSHLIVYDRSANTLYELFCVARPNDTVYPYGGAHPTGQWGAYQVSYWDLNTNYFRTLGHTSADAAGLPILPGLVRPDETIPTQPGAVPVIDHAIRMTVQKTRGSYVFPASHEASNLTATNLPRMGERFRLKSSFVIPTNWSPEARAIATAMQKYGLIVADNGSDMYFTGTPSNLWDMEAVLQVQSLTARDFEVVDLTPIVTGLNITSGPSNGGTTVTIAGKNFSGAAGELHVLSGSLKATSVTVLSDTQVVAVSPAHAIGTVDVRVQSGSIRTNGDGNPEFFGYGTSAVVPAGQFTYDDSGPDGAPTAADDAYSVVHGKTLSVSAALGVLANDVSNPVGRSLSTVLVAGPSHGTLTLNANGSFTYVPAAGYAGADSFTYKAKDATLESGLATVALAVTNKSPVAVGDSYSTRRDTTLSVSAAGVLANDTDGDGDALSASLVLAPAHGTVTFNANGSFTYAPAAGYVGLDSFTYKASDGLADSPGATVNLTVAPPPAVEAVVINDGSAQRSLVRSITVRFDTRVTLDLGAFRVARADGTAVSLGLAVSKESGKTKVVLTFSGTGTTSRSLNDGLWTLRVFRAKVHRADDAGAVMDADSLTSFHRFYGDSDGDRDVDTADKTAFNAAFGKTDAISLSTFDYNRDGLVNSKDRTQFDKRFGRTI